MPEDKIKYQQKTSLNKKNSKLTKSRFTEDADVEVS